MRSRAGVSTPAPCLGPVLAGHRGRVAMRRMRPQLPPPDPNEWSGAIPEGVRLPAPAAIFMAGPPSPEGDRLSDAILSFRPGLVFIAVRD